MKYWAIPLVFFIIEGFTHQRLIVSGIYVILVVLGFIYEMLLDIKKELKKQKEKEND